MRFGFFLIFSKYFFSQAGVLHLYKEYRVNNTLGLCGAKCKQCVVGISEICVFFNMSGHF